MADIVEVVIKSTSGFCDIDSAYNDKFTITDDSIAYVYTPRIESELNPKREWSYKTNSHIFQMWFKKLTSMLPEMIKNTHDVMCSDAGSIEFNITYADKSVFNKTYCLSEDQFYDLLKLIKQIVPQTEYTPTVLSFLDDVE